MVKVGDRVTLKARISAFLTKSLLRGKIKLSDLGVRLVVGQRTLDPYAEVRILDPQQERGVIVYHSSFFYCVLPSGTIFTSWM